jgi:hypothetical protein
MTSQNDIAVQTYGVLAQIRGTTGRSDVVQKMTQAPGLDLYEAVCRQDLNSALSIALNSEFRLFGSNSGGACTASTNLTALYALNSGRYSQVVDVPVGTAPLNGNLDAAGVEGALLTGAKELPEKDLLAIVTNLMTKAKRDDATTALSVSTKTGATVQDEIRNKMALLAAIFVAVGGNWYNLANEARQFYVGGLKPVIVDSDGSVLQGAVTYTAAAGTNPASIATAWTHVSSDAAGIPYALKFASGAVSSNGAASLSSLVIDNALLANFVDNLPTTMKSKHVTDFLPAAISNRGNFIYNSQWFRGAKLTQADINTDPTPVNANTDVANATPASAAFAASKLSGNVSGPTLGVYLQSTVAGNNGIKPINHAALAGTNVSMGWLKAAGSNATNYGNIDTEINNAKPNPGAVIVRGIFKALPGTALHDLFSVLDQAELEGISFPLNEWISMLGSLKMGKYETLNTSTGAWTSVDGTGTDITAKIEQILNKYDPNLQFSGPLTGDNIAAYFLSQAQVPSQANITAFSTNVLSKERKMEHLTTLVQGGNPLADALAKVHATPAVQGDTTDGQLTTSAYILKQLGNNGSKTTILGQTQSDASLLVQATIEYIMKNGYNSGGSADMRGVTMSDVPGLMAYLQNTHKAVIVQESSGSTDPNHSDRGVHSLFGSVLILQAKDQLSKVNGSLMNAPKNRDGSTPSDEQKLDLSIRGMKSLEPFVQISDDRFVVALTASFANFKGSNPDNKEVIQAGRSITDAQRSAWIVNMGASTNSQYGSSATDAHGSAELRSVAMSTSNGAARRGRALAGAKAMHFSSLNTTTTGTNNSDNALPAWGYGPVYAPTVSEAQAALEAMINESSAFTALANADSHAGKLQFVNVIYRLNLGAALASVVVDSGNEDNFNDLIKRYSRSAATNVKSDVFFGTGASAITTMGGFRTNITPQITQTINYFVDSFLRPAALNPAFDLASALVGSGNDKFHIFGITLIASSAGEINPENVRLNLAEQAVLREANMPQSDLEAATHAGFEANGYEVSGTSKTYLFCLPGGQQ